MNMLLSLGDKAKNFGEFDTLNVVIMFMGVAMLRVVHAIDSVCGDVKSDDLAGVINRKLCNCFDFGLQLVGIVGAEPLNDKNLEVPMDT